MNRTEQLALEHLRSLGYTDIRYEPDGNVPPDFVVDGYVAVEVRRLDQAHEDGRGLDEVAIPLAATMRNIFGSLGPPKGGVSWFVSYSFRRPLPSKPDLQRAVREYLAQIAEKNEPADTSARLFHNFKIRVLTAEKQHDKAFILGAFSDHQSGGWVISELLQNLRRCLAEKAAKVAPHRARYPQWWLMLGNEIAYTMDIDDRATFRPLFTDSISPFSKVILFNPNDPRDAFEIA